MSNVPLIKIAIAKIRPIKGGLRLAAMHPPNVSKDARSDSGQENMLAIPYTIVFQFQEHTREVYAICMVKGDRRLLQWKVRHEVEFPTFFGQHVSWGEQDTDHWLRYIEIILIKPILTVWLNILFLWLRKTNCNWIALPNLSQRAVNRM